MSRIYLLVSQSNKIPKTERECTARSNQSLIDYLYKLLSALNLYCSSIYLNCHFSWNTSCLLYSNGCPTGPPDVADSGTISPNYIIRIYQRDLHVLCELQIKIIKYQVVHSNIYYIEERA